MSNIQLNALNREANDTAKSIRQSKQVPAVVYGPKQDPISIKLGNSDVIRSYRSAGGSTIVSLNIDGNNMDVLYHQVQKHPITGSIIHIDFYAIVAGEKLQTNISLEFVGTSEAKRDHGAIIDEVLREVEVRCLPKDLVNHFEVNLGLLKEVGDTITVADLGLDSEKYEVLNNLEDVIAVATAVAEEDLSVEVDNTILVNKEEESSEDA